MGSPKCELQALPPSALSFGYTISPSQANFDGSPDGSGPSELNRQKTMPVGSFPANAFGLYDMHGNAYAVDRHVSWTWNRPSTNRAKANAFWASRDIVLGPKRLAPGLALALRGYVNPSQLGRRPALKCGHFF
jgi:hypothetical protein